MLTATQIQQRLQDLESLIEEQYKPTHPAKDRDWRTYEQQWAHRLRSAMQNLEPLIDQACCIQSPPRRGRPHALPLKQRLLLVLLQPLLKMSNRVMAGSLVLFSLLTGIDASYKLVERAHSDPEVQLALSNLHTLMLRHRGVRQVHATGDGTGYGLVISRHYATTATRQGDKAKENRDKSKVTEPTDTKSKNSEKSKEAKAGQKKVKRWVYSFRLLDLDTRLYVAYGTSMKSERAAYEAALAHLERIGVQVVSVRLDRYYSFPSDAKRFPGAQFYVLPRKNIAHIPVQKEWVEAMQGFVDDTIGYLEEYYRRQHSEAAFSADKRITGWINSKRRVDRIRVVQTVHATWHNLLNLFGPDHGGQEGAGARSGSSPGVDGVAAEAAVAA